MEQKYSKALIKSNIVLGVHSLLKGILVLLLFIILYSIIWIREKYLNYIKISVYIQLIIFLFLIVLILITNNPRFFDICLNSSLYIFLIISIFQISIIIMESLGLIANLKQFVNFFHECPYYRTYNDILESKYQRSCLFYNEDPYSEEQYKYICFYNSEEEYFDNFCDGLLCQKNNNFYDNENDFVKCIGVNTNLIAFPENSIYYKKEKQLFDKKKNKKVYLCSRKKRLDEIIMDSLNENDNDNGNDDEDKSKSDMKNIECPDNNPMKKYIVFIYIEIILHFLADLLFVYEFFMIKNLNVTYFQINVNNHIVIPINTIVSQSNMINNRVNATSVNRIIVNIDKKKSKNSNLNEINSENEEEKKIDNNSEMNNVNVEEENNSNHNNNVNLNIKFRKKEENDYNRHKSKLKMIDNNVINNNGYINIINVNQNIRIAQNTNVGSVLLNALKSPKKLNKFKIKKSKEKINDMKTNENEEGSYKKHVNLKSSQLKYLINLENDNDNEDDYHNSSNEENKNPNKTKEYKINNKLNEDLMNNLKNIKKSNNEGTEKQIYRKKNLGSGNDVRINKNNKKVSSNENSLKNFVQKNNSTNKYKPQEISYNGKKDKMNKNMENNFVKNEENKTFKKTLIENMHINSEFFLNDEELDRREKEREKEKQRNNKKKEIEKSQFEKEESLKNEI